MIRQRCKRCLSSNFYLVRRGRKRCKKCGYEFKPRIANFNLTKQEWRKLIFWFVLEQPIREIEKQTALSHYSVSKATKLLRVVMTKDVPGIFSGTVEVDETYLGGQKKNKKKKQLIKDKIEGKESKRGRGTTKQPVFGILTRQGKVFAELVDDVEAKNLLPIISKKVKIGSSICSDTAKAYTGLAAKGYVHRTVEHKDKEYVNKTDKTNHINGLEGFWGYLKRKLGAKGGVQRKYLNLFLGEYVWRYNYRELSKEEQISRLLNQVINFSG
ncbi:MAG: IS1595 family transposase [Patescibacteria group bacterium]